ncbi:MAG: hypothetical protein WEB00_15070 [Dehalococcoidia bacterium]
MATVFPSVEWFQEIQKRVNEDPAFKKLGTADAAVGIKFSDRPEKYLLTFEAFEVVNVAEAGDADLEAADFYLELPYDTWKEMIANIKMNGHADLHHTLNTIDLELPEGFARSKDEYRRDLFYRFNQTFQDFFNKSAELDTQFA